MWTEYIVFIYTKQEQEAKNLRKHKVRHMGGTGGRKDN